MSTDREYGTLGWTFSYLPHLGISLLAKAQSFPLCCHCPPPPWADSPGLTHRADPPGLPLWLNPRAYPYGWPLGAKPFKMGPLSRLFADSSFSTKAFEKNHPPPDYKLLAWRCKKHFKKSPHLPNIFLIHISISELNPSQILFGTVWPPGGVTITLAKNWNFWLKFFGGNPFWKKTL